MPNFKTRLAPWADRWWTLQRDIESWLRESTDDELAQIERDVLAPNSTNCWFATYQVAGQIREAIQGEKYRRARLASREPRSRRALGA